MELAAQPRLRSTALAREWDSLVDHYVVDDASDRKELLRNYVTPSKIQMLGLDTFSK
jgi:hypothetical protein